jgi:hypothetical protein
MTATTADTDFSGLTDTNCCAGCDSEYCVISGKAYCAHPRKGGLHHGQMQDANALRRVQIARDQLAHDAVTARMKAQRTA